MLFINIYTNLCESRKSNKEFYKPKSGLHRHHIIPEHSGGSNEESNLTYLTIREHIIAHYLLWKINKDPNDLRSMNMLGAKLTTEQRQIIGKWCFENKIGYFSDKFSPKQKREWRLKGIHTQILNKVGIFNPNVLSYKSLGGKASIISPNNPWSYWASLEGQRERASMGAKAHTGKKSMYKSGDTTFIRVSPENIQQKIDEGYILGSPLKNNLGKTLGPSQKRKKVTDGITIYDSLKEAGEAYSVSNSSICHWCKDPKKPNWIYII